MPALIRVCCLLFLLPALLPAQQATNVSSSDADYPTISVDFTFRSPDSIGSSATLLEDGRSIPYTIQLREDSLRYDHKRILLLFENSYRPRFEAQRSAGISLLKRVFREAIREGDEVYIAHFDWTIDGAPDFRLLNEEPVDNAEVIQGLLDQITQPPSDGRVVEETEIYPALMDGLDFMAAHADSLKTHAPLILLYSAEATNIHFSRFSQNDIVMKSRELDVPVYTIQYPYYRDKYSFAELSAKTYGERIVLQEESVAVDALVQQLEQAPLRASGRNYTIQFESGKPAGSAHQVSLQLSNLEQLDLTYYTESAIVYWFRPTVNKIIAIGGLMMLLAVAIGWWLFVRSRRRQQREQDKASRDKQLQQVSEEAAAALDRQKAAFDKQLQAREQAIQEQAKKEATASRLATIQTHFDRLPRVPCLLAESGERHLISRPRVIVGRGPQADTILSDPSISKTHATIAFATFREDSSGTLTDEFYIWDMGSTNGTYVNGYPVVGMSDLRQGKQPQPLKDQDLVQFGGQQFVFTI